MSERHFEDVDLGDEFEGEWAVDHDVVVSYLSLDGAGRGDDTPRRFTDPESARRLGLERPIAPGVLCMAVLTRHVTDWMGDRGRLASIDVNFRRPVYHGDRLRFVGLVTDIEASDAGGEVKLDVYFENERGERPLQGVAVIELPTRAS